MVRNQYFHVGSRKALIYDSHKNKVARLVRDIKLSKSYSVEGTKQEIKILADSNNPSRLLVKMSGADIGYIDTPFVAMSNTFKLHINDDEDAPILVALTIGIDNINDAANKHK